VYKSTDSGRTWTLLTGTNNSNPFKGLTISKIVVDPLNQNIIYAAVANNGVNGSGVPGRVGKTGIWKYDGTKWINLTQIASAYRTSKNLGPGPDDDDNTIFSASEDYTDVAVVVDPSNSSNRFIMFALGTASGGATSPTGTYSNAAFISLDSGQTWNEAKFPTTD